ncbi:MAG: penicillin-binding protein [Deltaproteobacteria bacterium CG11_big_fil_rev_8_21_14_0_20_47_16]|nr:MAG: penicillin-binding protein [Deltaproteobacteria bacterium CG11_big_fil_rev_8_21_14_0_20_47_16]
MAQAQPSLANQWMRREKRMRVRLAIVASTLLGGFVLVIGRGVYLQVKDNHNLEWVASKQYRAVVPVAARRGKILDTNGKELAVSMPVSSIYADGRYVKDVNAAVNALVGALSLGVEEVRDLRSQLAAHKKFVWIKRKVDPEIASQIKAMNISGLRFVEESKRVYPSGKLASTVLGAVGMDSEGLAGIEMEYDKELKSQHSKMYYQRDARGRLIYTPVAFKDQSDVGNVELTIDKTIQFITESALDRAVVDSKSRSGVAIVMDPKTGAILAMASSPNFNPNEYSKYPLSTWRNRALSDAYEPGSTFKVLTVATALDQSLVKPEQRFDCMNGAIAIGNATIHDHDPYGMLSVKDIIKVSSNIGAYKIAQVIGRERLYNSLYKFGIGQKTEIDFPGEVAGLIHPSARWSPVELATVSFGQGVTATPLQLAVALSTIANGGMRMKPYLVKRVEDASGHEVFRATPTVVDTVIKPETARLVLDIMKSVVGQGGTAKLAASDEFSVAGKTGTAQKVMEGSGRYAAGKFFASFVGVAPVEDPRVTIFVGLDEPQNGHFGGQLAGPVFLKIAESSLHYMAVPGKSTSVVMKTAEPSESKKIALKKEALTGVAIRPFKVEGRVSELLLPDMTGWPVRRVVAMLRGVEAHAELEGAGRAVAQVPMAGTIIKPGEKVTVRFALPN